MTISPSRFRRAYHRFQSIHEQECGWPLDSFSNRDSFAFRWEGYKQAIPERAGAVLNASRWTKNEVGSGEILKRVIAAIELQGNNLLQWEARQGPASRAHSRLYEAQDEPVSRRDLESLFFDLFKLGKANKETFEGIVDLCGKRYELLGYLFFIADPGRFLSLRTRSFDNALVELGVDLKTEGRCGWDNYLAFIEVIQDVRTRLQAEGIVDASLLDAHSFCWILARHEGTKQTVESGATAQIRPFKGTLRPAVETRSFSLNDDAEIRNMQEVAARCHASGQIAEEVALEAERNRLCNEGRSDLAALVRLVADRPGLGYDIQSFDADGTDRFIEVKNVSNGNRFFLSEGEWLNSRERLNYWFYLVSKTGSPNAIVSLLSADHLKSTHLRPVQYLVSFE